MSVPCPNLHYILSIFEITIIKNFTPTSPTSPQPNRISTTSLLWNIHTVFLPWKRHSNLPRIQVQELCPFLLIILVVVYWGHCVRNYCAQCIYHATQGESKRVTNILQCHRQHRSRAQQGRTPI